MPNKTATFNTTAGSFTVELYTDTMPVTACKTPQPSQFSSVTLLFKGTSSTWHRTDSTTASTSTE